MLDTYFKPSESHIHADSQVLLEWTITAREVIMLQYRSSIVCEKTCLRGRLHPNKLTQCRMMQRLIQTSSKITDR